MPHQHPRPSPIIPRIIPPNHIPPLLRSLDILAISTAVPPARRILRRGGALHEEAPVGDARVGRPGLEDVRVGAHEDLCHHGAGGGAGDVDAVGVAAVFGHGVGDHVGDGLGVAAAVVGEGYLLLVCMSLHFHMC